MIQTNAHPGRQGRQKIEQLLGQLNSPRNKSKPSQSSTQSATRAGNRQADVCGICGNLGFVRQELPIGHPNFGKLTRCSCKAAEDTDSLQQVCGLSRQELAIRLDDIDLTLGGEGTRRMVSAVRAFIQQPQGMISIIGTCGNAKTMALMATVNELTARGVEAVYVTAFSLLSYIREAFNDKGQVVVESAYQRLKRFEAVRMLALDELDKAGPYTDWELKQLTDLFDWRYRSGDDGTTGTILAMNKTDVLPDWIMSRLQYGYNHWIENNDPDLRPRIGKSS
jgi:DNA replication protein DnaC